jgi:DNA-binding transcriptional ArsR family regulator
MGKPIDEKGYFIVYHWMSKLQIISEDKKGKFKTDKNGNKITEPLSGVAKELYAIIYRWSRGDAGCCYYSYAQFEKITGSSKSTIIRSLDRLYSNELILRDKIYDKDKKDRDIVISQRYRVNIAKIKELGIQVDETLEKREHERNMWSDYIGDDEDIDMDMGDNIDPVWGDNFIQRIH